MTATTLTTEDRIRAAYQYLADRPHAWVSLTELRLFIQDIPRAEQDRALIELLRHGALIIPFDNQKTLTQADREAAAWIGGQWKHMISFW